MLLSNNLPAQNFTAIEKKIVENVKQHHEGAIAFLNEIVNINSGTLNVAGVREVGKAFQSKFDEIGLKTRWISMPDSVHRSAHLFAERHGKQGKRLLLIGHLDTVFEMESPFQRFVGRTPAPPAPASTI